MTIMSNEDFEELQTLRAENEKLKRLSFGIALELPDPTTDEFDALLRIRRLVSHGASDKELAELCRKTLPGLGMNKDQFYSTSSKLSPGTQAMIDGGNRG